MRRVSERLPVVLDAARLSGFWRQECIESATASTAPLIDITRRIERALVLDRKLDMRRAA